MRRLMVLLAFPIISIAGCSERAVAVSGMVKFHDGKPVNEVKLVFFPDDGVSSKVRSFELENDGSFHGEAMPGGYTFYLSRKSVETDEDGVPVNKSDFAKHKAYEKAFKRVSKSYWTPEAVGPDRKIQISAANSTFSLTLAR